MPTIRKWEDLTTDKETLATIRELYGDDVEHLDFAGWLARGEGDPRVCHQRDCLFHLSHHGLKAIGS